MIKFASDNALESMQPFKASLTLEDESIALIEVFPADRCWKILSDSQGRFYLNYAISLRRTIEIVNSETPTGRGKQLYDALTNLLLETGIFRETRAFHTHPTTGNGTYTVNGINHRMWSNSSWNFVV